jgi:hypothetical protein
MHLGVTFDASGGGTNRIGRDKDNVKRMHAFVSCAEQTVGASIHSMSTVMAVKERLSKTVAKKKTHHQTVGERLATRKQRAFEEQAISARQSEHTRVAETKNAGLRNKMHEMESVVTEEKALGALSRYGDGDGSYWDRWLTKAPPVSSRYKSGWAEPISGYKKSMSHKNHVVMQAPEGVEIDDDGKPKVLQKDKSQKTYMAHLELSDEDIDEVDLAWQRISDKIASPDLMQSQSHEEMSMLLQREANLDESNGASSPTSPNKYTRRRARHAFFSNYQHQRVYNADNGRAAPSASVPSNPLLPLQPILTTPAGSNSPISEPISGGRRRISVAPIPVDDGDVFYNTVQHDFASGCVRLSIPPEPLLLGQLSPMSRGRRRKRFAESRAQDATADAKVDDTESGVKLEPWRRLLLRHRQIGPELAQILATCLPNMASLEHVDLCDNRLSAKNIYLLLTALEKLPPKALRSLSLSCNRLPPRGFTLVPGLIHRSISLVRIALSRTNLSDAQGVQLARALHDNIRLTHVDASENALGSNTGVALAESLRANITLKHLQLRWNAIRGEGACALMHALRENEALETLELGDNGIDDESAEVLSTSLRSTHSSALRTLSLERNRVGAVGTLAIVDALPLNSSLSYLALDGNPIGSAGVRAIVHMLNRQPVLAASSEVPLLLSVSSAMENTPDANGSNSANSHVRHKEAGGYRSMRRISICGCGFSRVHRRGNRSQKGTLENLPPAFEPYQMPPPPAPSKGKKGKAAAVEALELYQPPPVPKLPPSALGLMDESKAPVINMKAMGAAGVYDLDLNRPYDHAVAEIVLRILRERPGWGVGGESAKPKPQRGGKGKEKEKEKDVEAGAEAGASKLREARAGVGGAWLGEALFWPTWVNYSKGINVARAAAEKGQDKELQAKVKELEKLDKAQDKALKKPERVSMPFAPFVPMQYAEMEFLNGDGDGVTKAKGKPGPGGVMLTDAKMRTALLTKLQAEREEHEQARVELEEQKKEEAKASAKEAAKEAAKAAKAKKNSMDEGTVEAEERPLDPVGTSYDPESAAQATVHDYENLTCVPTPEVFMPLPWEGRLMIELRCLSSDERQRAKVAAIDEVKAGTAVADRTPRAPALCTKYTMDELLQRPPITRVGLKAISMVAREWGGSGQDKEQESFLQIVREELELSELQSRWMRLAVEGKGGGDTEMESGSSAKAAKRLASAAAAKAAVVSPAAWRKGLAVAINPRGSDIRSDKKGVQDYDDRAELSEGAYVSLCIGMPANAPAMPAIAPATLTVGGEKDPGILLRSSVWAARPVQQDSASFWSLKQDCRQLGSAARPAAKKPVLSLVQPTPSLLLLVLCEPILRQSFVADWLTCWRRPRFRAFLCAAVGKPTKEGSDSDDDSDKAQEDEDDEEEGVPDPRHSFAFPELEKVCMWAGRKGGCICTKATTRRLMLLIETVAAQYSSGVCAFRHYSSLCFPPCRDTDGAGVCFAGFKAFVAECTGLIPSTDLPGWSSPRAEQIMYYQVCNGTTSEAAQAIEEEALMAHDRTSNPSALGDPTVGARPMDPHSGEASSSSGAATSALATSKTSRKLSFGKLGKTSHFSSTQLLLMESDARFPHKDTSALTRPEFAVDVLVRLTVLKYCALMNRSSEYTQPATRALVMREGPSHVLVRRLLGNPRLHDGDSGSVVGEVEMDAEHVLGLPESFRDVSGMYMQDVDTAFKTHLRFLRSTFERLCDQHNLEPAVGSVLEPRMGVTGWVRFVSTIGLLEKATDDPATTKHSGPTVTIAECRQIFLASRSLSIADAHRPQKPCLLDFSDFLEAVARLAHRVPLPSEYLLERIGYCVEDFFALCAPLAPVGNPPLESARQQSFFKLGVPQPPMVLAERVDKLLRLASSRLAYCWELPPETPTAVGPEVITELEQQRKRLLQSLDHEYQQHCPAIAAASADACAVSIQAGN